MDMTFDQYIQNPMGIKNAVFSNREMYRTMYRTKWDAIKLRENGMIDFAQYKSKSDYFLYIKIPSEVVPNFYYDVVIRFYPPKSEKAPLAAANLDKYNVQFYSNDPSFVFTFAHAFSKNDLFINDLSTRMSKIALKQKAVEKNPNNQVGYVKSLYFAYLEMKNKGLFAKLSWSTAKTYDKNLLLSMIVPADIKIDQRQKEEAAINKKKRAAKAKPQNTQKIPEEPPKLFSKNRPISQINPISSKSKITGKSKMSGKSKLSGNMKSKP